MSHEQRDPNYEAPGFKKGDRVIDKTLTPADGADPVVGTVTAVMSRESTNPGFVLCVLWDTGKERWIVEELAERIVAEEFTV